MRFFLLQDTLSFRVERLIRISAAEDTPVPLDEQKPKLVLHMVPLNAFNTSISLNLRPLNDASKGRLLNPLVVWEHPPKVDMRFNIDGVVCSSRRSDSPSTIAYTQVFRNDIIETVDMSILGVYENRIFSGVKYEKRLLEAVKRFIDLQKFLGVNPPVFIMVSFLGVKGYRISHKIFYHTKYQASDEIDRMNLIIPEIMLDNFDADIAATMRPIFDTVWNAAGHRCSPNYDTSSQFTLG